MRYFFNNSNCSLIVKSEDFIFRFIIIAAFFSFFCINNVTAQKKSETDVRSVPVKIDNCDAKIQVLNIEKKIKNINEKLTYYWFKNNEIHMTQGGIGGKLLHGSFISYYGNKNLKEQGFFNYGLKNGKWTEWYENNKIKSVSSWKNGLLDGKCTDYDADGIMVQQTSYKNGLLHGNLIVYKNDTIISTTKYNKGKVIENTGKTYNANCKNKSKSGFFKNTFLKKDKKKKLV